LSLIEMCGTWTVEHAIDRLSTLKHDAERSSTTGWML
jgi:hypothetical protein